METMTAYIQSSQEKVHRKIFLVLFSIKIGESFDQDIYSSGIRLQFYREDS